ncbi:MAG TPA: PASTA domain-containing protein [Syntrophorhabdales bacterium]|nr:PASTA domain-containing protein [Syntrophorhabdales bacterium]
MSWLKTFLYCCAFVAVFAISSYVAMRLLIQEQGTITCPDLVGKELSDAKRLAGDRDLSVVVSRYEKRKEVPYNYIISQRPEPSMPVRKGRTLLVVVSEGPLLVDVPLLTNHNLTYAEETLKDKSLPLKKVINVPSGNVGTVLAQSPGSGRNIVDDEGVTLVLGTRQKRFYIMPDLVGRPVAEVINELETKQIKYNVTYVERPGKPQKTILETSIPPKMLFGEDDTVQILAVGG